MRLDELKWEPTVYADISCACITPLNDDIASPTIHVYRHNKSNSLEYSIRVLDDRQTPQSRWLWYLDPLMAQCVLNELITEITSGVTE